jgi:hypothetical protein
MFSSKVGKGSVASKEEFESAGAAYETDSDNDSDAGEAVNLFGDAVEFDSDEEDANPAPAPVKKTQLVGEQFKLDQIHAALSEHPDFSTKLLHLEAKSGGREIVGYVNGKEIVAENKNIDMSQFDEATQVMFHEKKRLTETITGQPIEMHEVVHRHFNSGISRKGEANSRGETAAVSSLASDFDQAAALAGSSSPEKTKAQIATFAKDDPVGFRTHYEESISRALNEGKIDDTFRQHLRAYARLSGLPESAAAQPTPAAIKTTRQLMNRAVNDHLPQLTANLNFDKSVFVNALLMGEPFHETLSVGGKSVIATGAFSKAQGEGVYTVSVQIDGHPSKVEILKFTPSGKANKVLFHTAVEPVAPRSLMLHVEKAGEIFAEAAQSVSMRA